MSGVLVERFCPILDRLVRRALRKAGWVLHVSTRAAATARPARPGGEAKDFVTGEASRADTASAVWIVVPTYNESENLVRLATEVLRTMPGAHLLVVDDASPDGTGEIADELAQRDQRISVLHRREKNGLGRAYLAGFELALAAGADVVIQMDADFSHDPAALPSLAGPVVDGEADLVIGSRYVAGGGVVDWGLGRRVVSRVGSIYARLVLGLGMRDLTGGYKAWRAGLLRDVRRDGVRAGGYVFQIEMTYRASRDGARIAEVPITFRDRTAGVSKMDRRIVTEALLVVLQLRLETLLPAGRRARAVAVEGQEIRLGE